MNPPTVPTSAPPCIVTDCSASGGGQVVRSRSPDCGLFEVRALKSKSPFSLIIVPTSWLGLGQRLLKPISWHAYTHSFPPHTFVINVVRMYFDLCSLTCGVGIY